MKILATTTVNILDLERLGRRKVAKGARVLIVDHCGRVLGEVVDRSGQWLTVSWATLNF